MLYAFSNPLLLSTTHKVNYKHMSFIIVQAGDSKGNTRSQIGTSVSICGCKHIPLAGTVKKKQQYPDVPQQVP